MSAYPDIPGHQATDTSKEAADRVFYLAKRHEDILWALDKWGPMTSDDVASRLGIEVLGTRPRLTELKLQKRIYDTGRRELNRSGRRAIVYALMPQPTKEAKQDV